MVHEIVCPPVQEIVPCVGPSARLSLTKLIDQYLGIIVYYTFGTQHAQPQFFQNTIHHAKVLTS